MPEILKGLPFPWLWLFLLFSFFFQVQNLLHIVSWFLTYKLWTDTSEETRLVIWSWGVISIHSNIGKLSRKSRKGCWPWHYELFLGMFVLSVYHWGFKYQEETFGLPFFFFSQNLNHPEPYLKDFRAKIGHEEWVLWQRSGYWSINLKKEKLDFSSMKQTKVILLKIFN